VETEPWHVVEGKRGQQFLDRGETRKAREVFESILARLGDAPSYGRAVLLERLARSFHLEGEAELAIAPLREALNVLGRLPPTDGIRHLRGTLRSELGDAFRTLGRYDDARTSYEAALQIAEDSKNLKSQAIELGRLGVLALTEGKIEEAILRHEAALARCEQLGEPEAQARAWTQLARVFQQSGAWDEAERHYREAIRIDRERGKSVQLGRHLSALAELLLLQPSRLAEAHQLAEESVKIAQGLEPAGKEVWRGFGILADVLEKEAATAAEDERKAALLTQARDCRHLREYAPRFLATLARMSEEPSYARAVVLERLGRCFLMAGRPDVAAGSLAEGLRVIGRLHPSDRAKGLQGLMHSTLGDLLAGLGRHDEARAEYESALEVATEIGDVLGQEAASARLGQPVQPLPAPVPGEVSAALDLTVSDDVLTDCAFDMDLLVEGPRERRITRWPEEPVPVADADRPVVAPGVRVWTDDKGSVRFSLPLGEPIVEPDAECTVIQRTRREVSVAGPSSVVWHLARRMDGRATAAAIVSDLAQDEREVATRLLATLATVGVVDTSGRAIGRFLHRSTKKGVLPSGGLESDEVLALATDGSYREYADAAPIAVSESVPERLRAFHDLTRRRRSSRDYGGLAIARQDLDALLNTACGLTGAMPWRGREVKLRAYPSSGALYAVEIYPVALRVEKLEEGVYHYRVVENRLELVRNVNRQEFVQTALPVEREMVASAAAMICLTGVFPRHERKYGEGGYRMLVAEAGHISQNLVLAATALGLSARPFGGVFDDLVNRALWINEDEEQFLLAVLVGHDRRRP
jgi:SagB-type dehydrogenase family enzyme